MENQAQKGMESEMENSERVERVGHSLPPY